MRKRAEEQTTLRTEMNAVISWMNEYVTLDTGNPNVFRVCKKSTGGEGKIVGFSSPNSGEMPDAPGRFYHEYPHPPYDPARDDVGEWAPEQAKGEKVWNPYKKSPLVVLQ